MAVPHDTLLRYTEGVESGSFDRDLSPEDRAEVVRLLRMGVAILHDFGATSSRDLSRMLRDPQASQEANERVRDILFGCLTEGWTRTGLA